MEPAGTRQSPWAAGLGPQLAGKVNPAAPRPGAELTLRSAHRGDRVDDVPSALLSPGAPEPWAWGFSQKDRQTRLGGLQSAVPAELGLILAWLPSTSRGKRASPVGRKEPLCPVGCKTKDHLSPAPTFMPAHLPWMQPELLLYLRLRVHSSPPGASPHVPPTPPSTQGPPLALSKGSSNLLRMSQLPESAPLLLEQLHHSFPEYADPSD